MALGYSKGVGGEWWGARGVTTTIYIAPDEIMV